MTSKCGKLRSLARELKKGYTDESAGEYLAIGSRKWVDQL
jgi:hypothetical protein